MFFVTFEEFFKDISFKGVGIIKALAKFRLYLSATLNHTNTFGDFSVSLIFIPKDTSYEWLEIICAKCAEAGIRRCL